MPTKIEWTEETWNPITGCTKISEGCQNCYAERMAKRLAGRFGYPADDPFKPGTLHPDQLDKPFEWKKPRKVFVCSMGDILHDKVDGSDLVKVFDVMVKCPQHTFIILTKRADRLAWFNLNGPLLGKEPLPNLWLGVSVENQKAADERIPHLLRTQAVVTFVSVEPMLRPVDLTWVRFDRWTTINVLDGFGNTTRPGTMGQSLPNCYCRPLDWVICGGETGPGARPMQPEWAKSLRDQCVDAGVLFFFKGWGDWFVPVDYNACLTTPLKVGKKKAGRLLDGRLWNEYPEVRYGQ